MLEQLNQLRQELTQQRNEFQQIKDKIAKICQVLLENSKYLNVYRNSKALELRLCSEETSELNERGYLPFNRLEDFLRYQQTEKSFEYLELVLDPENVAEDDIHLDFDRLTWEIINLKLVCPAKRKNITVKYYSKIANFFHVVQLDPLELQSKLICFGEPNIVTTQEGETNRVVVKVQGGDAFSNCSPS